MARVFVAMSGGVDSSVAAALLLEQGHDVTGITMELQPSSDIEGGCSSSSAAIDAHMVCELLGIEHLTADFHAVFEREVVGPFAEEYAKGRTPNPCIRCNDRVKFGDLLAHVVESGAEYLATGHYARVLRTPEGALRLARGLDAAKDQSYFLYRLTDAQLAQVLFPVGELHKSDVRAMAVRFGLPVADKAESQEACFASDGDYVSVVGARAPTAVMPGDIVDREGTVLGTHAGIAHHTVGQRKGLGIGGPGDPLYVLSLDAVGNRVVVGPRDALSVRHVEAGSVVWHGADHRRVDAAVRYRMAGVQAQALFDGSRLVVDFDEPLPGVSCGQSVVCYESDVVVGGGVIECVS